MVLWPFTRQKLTILRIFDHFRRQIDVNWRHNGCYLNKYSSDTLTDCRNRYKPLWKPLKSGIVAIYTTKIDDFAYFRSFLTLNWRQLTSYRLIFRNMFVLHTSRPKKSIKTIIKTIEKWYCGHLHDKNWQFCAFSIILEVKLTSIDIIIGVISINIILTH